MRFLFIAIRYNIFLILFSMVLSYSFVSEGNVVFYDFEDGTNQGWEADTSVDFLNNLSRPSASGVQAYNGIYSLAYPISFVEQDDNGTPADTTDDFINDVGKVVLNPPLNLVGLNGYKMYVYVPDSADIKPTNPAYVTIYLKTGPNWDWFETDPAQSAGGNITKGTWNKIEIDFSNCKNGAGQTGQQVSSLDDIHELGFHISGCGQATGTSTFYIDTVESEGAWVMADITVTVEGITTAIKITGSIDFGLLDLGAEVVSNTCLTIENIGTVPITLNLNLIDPYGWTAVQTNPGYNTYVLNAMFNDAKPSQSDFSEIRHALSIIPKKSTNVIFAGNQTGVYIQPGEKRDLWFEFRAPTITQINTQQSIKLVVSVEIAEPKMLGISLDTYNYDFGTLTKGDISVSKRPIIVTNTGNINETYWLQLTDPLDWRHSTVSPGIDVYVLNTVFDNDGVVNWDNTRHSLSTELTPCSRTRFAGDSSGMSVPSGERRTLWFQIKMPIEITGSATQNIRVIFVASES